MATVAQVHDYTKVLAGIERRVAARLLDLVVHLALNLMAIIAVAFIYVFLSQPSTTDFSQLGSRIVNNGPLETILGLIGMIAYHALTEGIGGQSLGKWIFRITVVMDDERRCTLRAAAVRSLVFLLDGFFFALPGLMAISKSDLQQRYGDAWAHTVVAKRGELNENSLKHTGRIWKGIAIGVVADVMILTIAHALNLYN